MSSIRSISEILSRAAAADAKFNIFTSLRSQSQIESNIKTLKSGSTLSNITLGVKANIATTQEPTTCSSRILANYKSPFDATVVKLLEDEGAVTIGKTNMDEFGMGAGTTFSHHGATLNPLYPHSKYVTGGSSGGSAAAVAAGLVDVALGTDTGGSVRLPAAFTGIFGFKPSYGRISRWGVIAYAQSSDTVGLLSKDLGNIKKVLSVVDKYDEKDPTSMSAELRKSIKEKQEEQPKNKKLRIGIIDELILDNLSDIVTKNWKQAIETLQQHHDIIPVSLPAVKYSLPTYFTVAPAEAASNLARYDGIRYGYRSDSDKNHYAKTRSTGFGPEVQNRIILGNYNLNSDSYTNHFLRAQHIRSSIRDQFNSVFKFPNLAIGNVIPVDNGVDVILSPAAMCTAPSLESFQCQDSAHTYANDLFTIPASLAGIPVISVPWGQKNEIPIGIQVMGQYGNDDQVLSFAQTLQELNESTK